jgi:hypothetical protein
MLFRTTMEIDLTQDHNRGEANFQAVTDVTRKCDLYHTTAGCQLGEGRQHPS